MSSTYTFSRLVKFLFSILLWQTALGGYALCVWTASEATRLCRTSGRWILDPKGRVLILRGINMSQSCKYPGFLPWQSEKEVEAMRGWGFNCVRLLLTWEALEPEPGDYQEEYLDKVAEYVDWCGEAKIYVILDMHQDVYARKYQGNGCPSWSCIDDGIPFKPFPGHWAMNYGTASVIRAFDNFWADKEGPGGMGVQERYVLAWQHVAERFKDHPFVLGYDMMNEPFYGSAIVGVAACIGRAVGQALPGESLSLGDLASKRDGGQDPMAGVMQRLVEEEKLFGVFDQASRPGQLFEAKRLQPFYNRLGQALRQADPQGILFFEPAGGAGSGTRLRTAVRVPRWNLGGPMPNCVFAPHHYEFAAEMGGAYPVQKKLVTQALARTEAARDQMDCPVWYGEWGAWNLSPPGIEEMVREHLDFFDATLCGWAWWQYGPDFKAFPLLPLLSRPYAQVIAGRPTRMRTTETRFELEFEPLPEGGETVIWVPPALKTNVEIPTQGVSRDEEGFVRLVTPAEQKVVVVRIGLNPAPAPAPEPAQATEFAPAPAPEPAQATEFAPAPEPAPAATAK